MITAINKSMAAKRDALKNDDKGFTLIELLVVVLIIGILAAIAIPAFLGQQNQAKDGAAKSDLGNAKLALVSYAAANNGVYDTATSGAALKSYGFVATEGVSGFTISHGVNGKFCLQVTSESSATAIFKITDSKGVASGACAAADVA